MRNKILVIVVTSMLLVSASMQAHHHRGGGGCDGTRGPRGGHWGYSPGHGHYGRWGTFIGNINYNFYNRCRNGFFNFPMGPNCRVLDRYDCANYANYCDWDYYYNTCFNLN
jgi:hypothetical protein